MKSHDSNTGALLAEQSSGEVIPRELLSFAEIESARFLQGEPILTLQREQAPIGLTNLRAWANGIFTAHKNCAIHPELGSVTLDERAIRDSLGHGLNPFKAIAFASIPKVLELGVEILRTRHANTFSHFVCAPVSIAGEDDIVTVLVHKDANICRMYLHSVTTKKNLLKASETSADAEAVQQSGKVTSGVVRSLLHRLLIAKLPKPATALILAAGRGERMRPLTDSLPKPLLKVKGKALITYHIDALVKAGFKHQLINTAWLGSLIPQALQDGSAHNAHLTYSHEGADFGYALETAGGIVRALPQLADVFWLVAGDVFVPEFAFSQDDYHSFTKSDKLAHLWLVPNPAHNVKGDFGIGENGSLVKEPRTHTYSTIALFKQSFFAQTLPLVGQDIPVGNPHGVKLALAPLLRAAADKGWVSGHIYTSAWVDVGTPERLAQIE